MCQKNRPFDTYPALVKEQIKEPNMCNAVNELFADQIKEKDLIIAEVRSQLADKDSQIANMGSQLADKDSQISARDAIIAQLQAELEKYSHKK